MYLYSTDKSIDATNTATNNDGVVNSQDSLGNEALKLSNLSKYCADTQSSYQSAERESCYDELNDCTKELLAWLEDVEQKNALWIGVNDGR